MRAEQQSMRRLGRGDEASSSLEARAGAFLQEARSTTGLGDGEIGAIERKLLLPRRRPRGLRLWPALAAIAVLLAAATGLALVGGWRPGWPSFTRPANPQRPHASSTPGGEQSHDVASIQAPSAESHVGPVAASESAPAAQPLRPARPSVARRRPTPTEKTAHEPSGESPIKAVAAMESPVSPDVGAAPARAAATHPWFAKEIGRPSVARAPEARSAGAGHSVEPSPSSVTTRRAASSEGAVVPQAPSSEARSLADALALWRRDGNADAALAMLAVHDRRYPRGVFAVESKIARAEILLALGRRPEALAVLDSLTLQGLPRARELETIRGELRVDAGRCPGARVDLADVLRGTSDDEFRKRASRALAQCP